MNLSLRVKENISDLLAALSSLRMSAKTIRGACVRHKGDLVCALVMAIVAATACSLLMLNIGNRLNPVEMEDKWFQADVGTMLPMISSRHTNQYKTESHPVSGLLMWAAVAVPRKLLGMDPVRAITILTVTISAFMTFVYFSLLRLIQVQRLDAMLFTLLLLSSSTWIFFAPIPETYALGATSILLAMLLLQLAQRMSAKGDQVASEALATAAVVTSFTITVTNVIVGIAGTWKSFRLGRAMQICINGFFVISMLWIVEKIVMPSSRYFLLNAHGLKHFMFFPDATRITESARALFLHSMSMPTISVASFDNIEHLSVQNSAIGQSGIFGTLSLIIWVGLVAIGLWSALSKHRHTTYVFVALSFLLCESALYFIYGEESFLYAMQFAPLLVLVAALGTTGKLRRIVIVGAVILIACNAINNLSRFAEALTAVDAIAVS